MYQQPREEIIARQQLELLELSTPVVRLWDRILALPLVGTLDSARNAIRYARGGSIEYHVEGERSPQVLIVHVADRGPGIPNLQQILDGAYRSQTGMGLLRVRAGCPG